MCAFKDSDIQPQQPSPSVQAQKVELVQVLLCLSATHLPKIHLEVPQQSLANHLFANAPSLQSEVAHPSLRDSQLTAPFDRPRQFNQPEPLDLLYVFSDGTALSIDNVLFHPYAQKLRKDLLPGLQLESAKKLFFGFLPDNEFDSRTLILYYLLLRAFQLSEYCDWQVGLCVFDPDATSSHFFQLKNILTSTDDLEQNVRVVLKPTINESSKEPIAEVNLQFSLGQQQYLGPDFIWDQKNESLRFHNFRQLMKHFQSQGAEPHPAACFIKGEDETWGHISIYSQSELNNIVHFIKTQFAGANFVVPAQQVDFSFSDIQLEVFLVNEFFSIAQNITPKSQNSKLEVWNFPSEIIELVQLLQTSIMDTPRAAQYIKHIGSYALTPLDHKLLRHNGVFLKLVHIVLQNWLSLRRESPDQKATVSKADMIGLRQQIRNLLFTQMHDIFIQIGVYSETHAQAAHEHFSMHANQIINNCIEDCLALCQKQDFYFTHKGLILHFQDGLTPYLILLKHWIDFIAQETEQQCFLRSQKSLLPNWPLLYGQIGQVLTENANSSPERALRYSSLSSENKFIIQHKFWFELQDLYNIRIVIEDQRINKLESHDFHAVFNMQDKSNDENNTGSAASTINKIDWFELSPAFFVKGEVVSEELAYKLSKGEIINLNGQLYRLDALTPELAGLKIYWDDIAPAIEDAKKQGRHEFYGLPKNRILDILALRAQGLKVVGSDRWQKVCSVYDSLGTTGSLPPPDSLNGNLKNYQLQGYTWLQTLFDLELGGILADEMGLGKTLQSLSFLENLRLQNRLGFALVVVPASLIFTWSQETTKFYPNLPLIHLQSKTLSDVEEFLQQQKHGIILCTYGMLIEKEAFLLNHDWTVAVFDEAQNLKNAIARRTTAARKLQAKFKLCLTGTPMENHLGELFSLVDLVVPGALGPRKSFHRNYLSDSQLLPEKSQYLRAKIKPLLLRRTKQQILKELPAKTEIKIEIPFSDRQRILYQEIASNWAQRVQSTVNEKGEKKSQVVMLTALLRLRQVCSDPSGIPGVDYSELPPKLLFLRDSVAEIVESDDSVLIFTQFLSTMRKIIQLLQEAHLPVFSLHGGMTSTVRNKQVEDFLNHPKGAVFVSTLKTGGTGLNLTKASYVFHVEPWWNPAVENQATDRTHRIGQQKPVTVYRLLMTESVEHKMEVLKERKSKNFQSLFSRDETSQEQLSGSSHLSKEDFEYLIKS